MIRSPSLKDMDAQDRVVLVTGASSGIGRALALQLVKTGARVGLMARREERLREVAHECGDESRALVLVGDVAVEADCQRVINTMVDVYGRLDLVINNAGVSMNARFEDVEMAVLHRMMDVNYFGSLYIARHAMSHLEHSGGGIVFVSSVVGKRGFPTRSGYSASKFAVHALFESLRVEWAPKGIYVGIVAPGYTDTEIRERALGANGLPRLTHGTTSGGVMSAERAAAAILEAAAKRRREVILTQGGKAMVWINKLLPRLADRLAARVIG